MDARHELGWCALHVAAINGDVDTARLLLQLGADPNARDLYTDRGV